MENNTATHQITLETVADTCASAAHYAAMHVSVWIPEPDCTKRIDRLLSMWKFYNDLFWKERNKRRRMSGLETFECQNQKKDLDALAE